MLYAAIALSSTLLLSLFQHTFGVKLFQKFYIPVLTQIVLGINKMAESQIRQTQTQNQNINQLIKQIAKKLRKFLLRYGVETKEIRYTDMVEIRLREYDLISEDVKERLESLILLLPCKFTLNEVWKFKFSSKVEIIKVFHNDMIKIEVDYIEDQENWIWIKKILIQKT